PRGRRGRLLLAALALLPNDGLLGVLHALALVWLGRPIAADVGGGLPQHDQIGPREDDAPVLGDLGLDALGERIAHRMREAEGQIEGLALGGGAITDAVDLQLALEAFGDPLDEV